ncbi:MAG: methyltransferase [Cytophagaceae bacterium]|jgi:tRNA1Val (adenine37-N6)-methyltransferase|nr:methyltransferase [Cytophagaceae bacterium]
MFRFKQFTIHQESNAMKVCTDSCLFGALIDAEQANTILDIGAGTGLLSVMLAQRSKAHILGLELNAEAAMEGARNANQSPWADRVKILPGDIRTFNTDAPFDLILSNPPFFRHSLRSPNEARNNAMQQEHLSFAELATCINRLLGPEGKSWILLPPYEMSLFQKEMQSYHFFHTYSCLVSNQDEEKPIREIATFSRKEESLKKEKLSIYKSDRSYTDAFFHLLEPYYLKLKHHE